MSIILAFKNANMEFSSKSSLPFLATIGFALALFTIFGQILSFDFVSYDDPKQLGGSLDSPAKLSAKEVKTAFTTPTLGIYTPLSKTSHLIDGTLFGNNPRGHHLINLVLHWIASVFFFLFLRSINVSPLLAFLLALCWSIHPLKVESVAWVSARKDVLSGVFIWMCCTFFVFSTKKQKRAYDKKSKYNYVWLTPFFMILAILAKPIGIILSPIILVLDFWRNGVNGIFKRGVFHLFLFLIALAGYGINYYMNRSVGGSPTYSDTYLLTRIWLIGSNFIFHLGNFVFPKDLTFFHLTPHRVADLIWWKPLCGFILFIFLTIIILGLDRKNGKAILGWLLFLLALAPVCGIIPGGEMAYADRWTYIPTAGLIILVGTIISFHKYRYLFLVMVLCIFGYTSYHQTKHWRNSKALYKHGISVNSNNFVAHINLGTIYFNEGRHELALSHYQAVLRDRPGTYGVAKQIAKTYRVLGLENEALKTERKAKIYHPDSLYKNIKK